MEKESSCINARVILDYVKEHNQGDCSSLIHNLHPEIENMPDPESFLRDPNNWVSCDVITELHERAKTLLHDDQIAFKIARFAIENTSLGYAQRILVKAFWSYKTSLRHAQKINDKWNRSKRVELRGIGRSEATVRLHWFGHMQLSKDICRYNKGVYMYMPLIWGGRPLTLEETSCFFEGADYCEYHLRWPARNRLYEILSRFFKPKSVLRETIREMEEGKKLIEQNYEEVNRLNVELNQKVKQLLAIQETGKAILSVLDLDQLLTVIMNLLYNVCKINRAIIMLVNEEGGYLEYIHAAGFPGGVPDDVRNYRVPLDRVSNILVRVTNTGLSEYVPDVTNSTLRQDNIILTHGRPTSVYVVPLITRSKVIGVLATDSADGAGVPKETRETLEIFSPQIAIAIENARLYSKLREQMKELKESQVLLSRTEKFSFLGNLAARLAHEIKNPMTAIGTFIQMLPRKYDDDEFRKDFYRVAMEETERVNNLITELLDLVRTKESRFEKNDLHSLIDKMILLVSPQSNEKKIEVIRDFDKNAEQVWLDEEKIKQVILNIISNAVEFTPQGGTIKVSTRRIQEPGKPDWIEIEISDSGVGIEKSHIGKIFDPYFTTKHKSSMHKGTGLGLSIAHQNIQDHGGSIEVKSSPDKGTAFAMRLPADLSKDRSTDS
jgi:signal transduction histidine kinase